VRSLGGRIGAALLVFALVTLLALGGSLWVALRDLHREAAVGALAELTAPLAGVVRARLPLAGELEEERPMFLERLRSSRAGGGDAALGASLEALVADTDASDISIVFLQGPNSFLLNPGEGTADTIGQAPAIAADPVRGQVATGRTRIESMGDVLYAATPLQLGRRGDGAPLIMLTRPDTSAEAATAAILRALAVAGVVLLLVGIPLAAGLSRSVARPLRRLALATSDVARGKIPEPVPTTGPVEVAEASAAFNAMAAEVGATRLAQRQLLADIRHDLRTPLTVIGGFAEALRDGTATGDAAVRAADAISDEAGRLERMLADLDQLTVAGASGPPLRLEAVGSLDVLRGAAERFSPEAEARGQALRIADDALETTFTTDRDALDRILGNLVANALTHAPSPGGQVTLEVQEARPGIILAVSDDGPGIPADALAHVFDRFYRADPSRTGAGSGLGLAIVRDLAEALGGSTFAENVGEGGARVGVRLPASGPPAAPETTGRP
jgi:signal transduction histidine kinase